MTSPIETNNVVERLRADADFLDTVLGAHPSRAARVRQAASDLQSLSDHIDVLEGEKAALEAALSPKRAHHEIARIKKLARDPEVAAYIDELEACWRYQQDRTDAWRGIASAMGYEPRAHNDVKPTSPWILARIAKFRASLTQGGKNG